LTGYAFAVGFTICHTLGYGALSSGVRQTWRSCAFIADWRLLCPQVSTIFVGLAEDPQVLAERDPALFEMIRRTYPEVATSV